MTRWCTLIAVLLVLGPSCDVTVDPPDDAGIEGGDADVAAGPLRVITWNLETFPVAANTVERVAELIEELDADLIGVQEIVDVSAFTDLVVALPEHDGIFANDPGSDMVVGLLFRDSRVRVIEETTLFPDNWYAFPRPPLMARIEILGAGASVEMEVTVLVVHLKARLDDASRERRLAACERLETWLSNHVSDGGGGEAIIIGDWNDELTDDAAWNVFSPFLDRPEQYAFLTMELAEAGGYTYIPFESFLDHILVTTETLDELGDGSTQILELEETVPNYEYTISDHRPVLAEFELPQ